MAEERKDRGVGQSPHRVCLEAGLLTVTGVKEVLRFDESSVLLQTPERLLLVRGAELALRQLAPGEGRVELRGRVDSLSYGGSPERSLRRRLLG